MIHAVFASSWRIRQSKLLCHITCDRRVADSFLWCTRVLVVYQNRKRVIWEPRWWNRSVFFFCICICDLSRHILYNDTFMFQLFEGGENHSVNRQNLRKTKWHPFFFFKSIRHLSMLHTDGYHVLVRIEPSHQKRPGGNTFPPQTDSLGLIDNTRFWRQGLIP